MVVVLCCVVQSILLGYSAYYNSPTDDEPGHIASGLSHWRDGTFDAYRVNPPLVRMVATFPLLAFRPSLSYSSRLKETPYSRNEFVLGRMWISENEPSVRKLVFVARLSCIPFVLLGGVVCYLWGSTLYGQASGIFSILLWTFCPNILGNGCLVTADVAAASTGVFSAYAFWLWSNSLSWRCSFLSAMALSLALLSKSTWLVLIPLWSALGVMIALNSSSTVRQSGSLTGRQTPTFRMVVAQLVTMFATAIFVVNAGYGFDGSFQPIGSFEFVSETLGGSNAHGITGNVLDFEPIRRIPSPLPADYIHGIDVQKHDFEVGKQAYLNGQFKHGGWWYYYLFAFLIKFPAGYVLATLVRLLDAAVGFSKSNLGIVTQNRGQTLPGRLHFSGGFTTLNARLILLLPGIVVFGLASSQTGINQGIRYVVPAFPFLYIWIGGLLRSNRDFTGSPGALSGNRLPSSECLPTEYADERCPQPPSCWSLGSVSRCKKTIRSSVAPKVAITCLALGIAESLACYPLSLSFFNLFVGGPASGSNHLIHANVDSGQDHYRMKEWMSANEQAFPFTYLYFGLVDREYLGIPFRGVATTADSSGHSPLLPEGWYAVSVNDLRRAHLVGNGDNFISWLAGQDPIDRIGHSIWIYHVKPDP